MQTRSLFHHAPTRSACPLPARRQRGVVLVIALIFMVVMSLLAMTSLHNAASSERVMGNVRTTELAAQAAEVALRHCEASVVDILKVADGGVSTYASTFEKTKIQPLSSPPHWQDINTWDSNSTFVIVLPPELVKQAGNTYKRLPECMVESVPVLLAGTNELSYTASFVVTARGFGPEVALPDADHSHPVGSEVWLQSHIQFQ
jgi:type IV pilus assembly protein PilX